MSLLSVSSINLHDFIPGSKYFMWHEFLFLPSWDVYVYPTAMVHHNILLFIKKCEVVREFLQMPMIVINGYRPREYNKQVGGARFSKHIEGRALDFYCPKYLSAKKCSIIRNKLKPKLAEFGIRMEDIDGDWVHIDDAEPGPSGRFFKP